jgi:DNA polymerase-1
MITKMEQTGLEIDLDHFEKMGKTLAGDMEKQIELIHSLTGYYINPGSGDQVADLLFSKSKLGLKQAKIVMTDSGDRESVADAVLTAIQHVHPVVPALQDYKEYEKLKGTYVDPMASLAVRVAHGVYRMFPHLGQTRVPAGRLNCQDPNLLAMPTRTKRGRQIRMGFRARKGWKVCSTDLSQIEVRIATHRSKDPNLIKIYLDKQDIYSDFAISANRLPDHRFRNDKGKWEYPGVLPMEHRRPCKICVLASIYDVTAMGLQDQMPVVCNTCRKPATCQECAADKPHTTCVKHDCGYFTPMWTEAECQKIINAFYARYQYLMTMRKADHRYMRETGQMVDMFGRLLHCQGVRSVHDWILAKTLREGSNFPMQSSAQGVIKLAMAAVMDALEAIPHIWEVVACLLQVHDELLFEAREDWVEWLNSLCGHVFRTVVPCLAIPLDASSSFADTWGDLEK